MNSKLNTYLLLLAALAMLAVTGCGLKQTRLTIADNNTQVTISVGERLVISLEGNPSTGYNWEVKELDAQILTQVGDNEFKSDNPSLVGSGGRITLTLEAKQAGTTNLVLIYHRLWETDVEPLETFTITVIVE